MFVFDGSKAQFSIEIKAKTAQKIEQPIYWTNAKISVKFYNLSERKSNKSIDAVINNSEQMKFIFILQNQFCFICQVNTNHECI